MIVLLTIQSSASPLISVASIQNAAWRQPCFFICDRAHLSNPNPVLAHVHLESSAAIRRNDYGVTVSNPSPAILADLVKQKKKSKEILPPATPELPSSEAPTMTTIIQLSLWGEIQDMKSRMTNDREPPSAFIRSPVRRAATPRSPPVGSDHQPDDVLTDFSPSCVPTGVGSITCKSPI